MMNVKEALSLGSKTPILTESGEHIFASIEEMNDTLLRQKETDVWCECRTNDMHAFALANCPICAESEKERYGVEYASTEQVVECMEKEQFGISFPIKNMQALHVLEHPERNAEGKVIRLYEKEDVDAEGDYVLPVLMRYTGIRGVRDRAGINGSVFSRLTPEENTMILNTCLAHWGSMAKILFRDGKISAVHSGDNSDYSILPVYDSVKVLQEYLYDHYGRSNVEFLHELSFLSHEQYTASYAVKNQKVSALFENVLNTVGYTAHDAELVVRHSTNDVARCGDNLSCELYLPDSGYSIAIGDALSLAHKHKACTDDFADLCKLLASSFEDSAKKLNELANIRIKHPLGCMKAIAKSLGIPKKWVLSKAGEEPMAVDLYASYVSTAPTAFEVYFNLWKVLEIMQNHDATPQEIFNMTENISRALNIDWDKYDYEFEWDATSTD